MSLDTLLASGAVDPLAMVQQVLQHLIGELARNDGTPGKPPDQLIAGAVGKRLARALIDDPRSGPAQRPAPSDVTDDVLDHDDRDVDDLDIGDVDVDELVERNLALAAALGACDCWGQDPGCPVCEGLGGPGWLPPDRQLFAAYVYPAMRAIGRASAEPTNPPNPPDPPESSAPTRHDDNQQQEDGNARHDAR